jgi:hypothetical protein
VRALDANVLGAAVGAALLVAAVSFAVTATAAATRLPLEGLKAE